MVEMALDLSDETSSELFSEVKKIARKYSISHESIFLGQISKKLLNIEIFLKSVDLKNTSPLISSYPAFDWKQQLIQPIYNYQNSTNETDLEKIEFQIIETAFALIFAYLTEYKLRANNLKKSENYEVILNFLDVGLWRFNEFLFVKDKIHFVKNHLLFEVIESKYQQSHLAEVDKIIEKVDDFLSKASDWDINFQNKQRSVLELEKRLENNKLTYDFVLLSKGFQQLYEQKKDELKKAKETYAFVSAVMFMIPFVEFIILIGAFLYFKGNIPSNMWLISIPFLTLVLITLYLVKISLQDKRSIQSQMMQLELRMALCQFIHNYAEDSEKLHAKNKAGFEKFENIIFSPLVSSDDKIPTTFDGMEQLAKLVSEFRK